MFNLLWVKPNPVAISVSSSFTRKIRTPLLSAPATWQRKRGNAITKRKKVDPIPEHFSSLEEASDFWDSHDAGDYEEYLRPVREKLTLIEQFPQAVLIEPSLMERLKEVARKRGVSVETLVNLWLEERILMGRV